MSAEAGRRRWRGRGLLVVALALLLWSAGIEPRWVARREIAHAVPGWTGPPLKVAVAADWHIGQQPLWRVMTPARARGIVDAINAAQPDIVLLPGDFIADRDFTPVQAASAAEEIAAELARLRAPLGVYAVLGNHDVWHGAQAMRQALQARGIRVLENEARQADAHVWVAGVGDHSTGRARPRQALAGVPGHAQALVLMHDPAAFTDLPPVRGLVVAGHTHGGQVRVPGIGALVLPGAAPRQWAYGWVQHAGQAMYVTSGLGVSLLPLRFNARPEWVLFTLEAATG